MDMLALIGTGICYPIRCLVRCLPRVVELADLTNRNTELSQQNRAQAEDLHFLQINLKKIQAQLCSELEGSGSYVDGSANPRLLESTLKSLNLKVFCVAKLFVDVMKSYGLDHKQALMENFNGIYLTRPGHVNFMLKAWIYSVFFENFENESFLPGGATLFLDHNQRKQNSFQYFQRIVSSDHLMRDYASETFFHRKLRSFLALWRTLLASPGQNRKDTLFHISNSSFSLAEVESLEPRTRKLMQAFALVANFVWALHKLCLSFEPCARIFRVDRGTEYEDHYMSSVVSKDEDPKFVTEVGFMISPGFYVGKSVIKSQIYLEAA